MNYIRKYNVENMESRRKWSGRNVCHGNYNHKDAAKTLCYNTFGHKKPTNTWHIAYFRSKTCYNVFTYWLHLYFKGLVYMSDIVSVPKKRSLTCQSY